jgi:putative iron-dependent peroxidase
MRFNMPFGQVGRAEFGTYYIAYARTSELIELMLSNMFLGDPPGTTDRILDFSTAMTGCLFFVPPAEMLDDFNAPGDEAPATAASSPAQDASDGSLSIGSLRGQPTDAER